MNRHARDHGTATYTEEDLAIAINRLTRAVEKLTAKIAEDRTPLPLSPAVLDSLPCECHFAAAEADRAGSGFHRCHH